MNRQQPTSGRPVLVGTCPLDAELRRFDLGTLSAAEAERLSDHVTGCDRCSTLLDERPRHETRLLAPILTPGTSLLGEREYECARKSLLDNPESILVGQLESAETSLSLLQYRDGRVPDEIGSYQLRYELGRGAMGVVYRARHLNLKRDVALKILHPQLTTDPGIVERFYGEMEAIGQLRDPHIVQAYDAGQSDGVHFLAMEYVDGANAGRLCAFLARLSVPNACEIVYQAALGLETARRHNMVHRDIKPSNLMVGRNGQVKVLDFGLASFRKEGMEHSAEYDAVGTVDYMAPEQWQGSPRIDVRADIYSLGCTLYKLLAGHAPFFQAPHDGVSKMQAHLYQVPPALRVIRQDVPKGLELLVTGLLSKKASDRVSVPQEVAEALHSYCTGSDLAALVEQCVPPTSDVSAEPEDFVVAKGVGTSKPRKRKRRWSYVALAAAFFAIMATITIRWNKDGEIEVIVNQAGAKIEVGPLSITTDDASQPIPLRLDRGKHQIIVSKKGFKAHQTTVEVHGGDPASVSITLEPELEPEESPTVLSGHKGPLEAIDISADGKWVVTGSADRTARLWDAQSGRPTGQFVGHEDAVMDVVFTPDGQHAVTGSEDRTARLWDVKTGTELKRYAPHRNAVLCVAVSEDGSRLLTGSLDAQVRLWNLHSGELLSVLGGHRSWVRGVTFLPGSRYAVSCGNDRIIILWDLDAGRMRRVLQGHTLPVCDITAASDGQHIVTCSEDTTIRLWNLNTEQQLNIMRFHVAPVRSVQFVPGSNFVVSSSDDRDVRLWNPFSGESIAEISGHNGDVNDVAVHLSSGLLASASADRTSRIHRLGELSQNPVPEDLVSETFEPPTDETTVIVQPIQKWTASQKGVQTIAVTPDGQWIASGGGEDRVVHIWQTETGERLRKLSEPTDGILCMRFSPDGQWLAAAGKDQHIYLWDMSTESPAKALVGHTGWVNSLAFSSTGDRILSGGFDATMRLWAVPSGRAIATIPGQIEWIRAVFLGGTGTEPFIISAGNAGCLRLWNSGKGPEGPVLGCRALAVPYTTGQFSSIAVSSEEKLVATAGWNRPLQLWDTSTGKLVAQFGDPNLTIYDLAWYRGDDRLLTACADGTLRLWDRRKGRELKRFVAHTDAVRCLSVSADSGVIVSGSEDGTIRIWPSEDTRTVNK